MGGPEERRDLVGLEPELLGPDLHRLLAHPQPGQLELGQGPPDEDQLGGLGQILYQVL